MKVNIIIAWQPSSESLCLVRQCNDSLLNMYARHAEQNQCKKKKKKKSEGFQGLNLEGQGYSFKSTFYSYF